MTFQLRDYQKNIIAQVVKKFREGYKAPCVVAPTGSGKTIIFSHIATGAVNKNKRVLILTHRREILQQTMSKLFSFGVQAGQISSGEPMTNELIQVAMIGTVVRRLKSIVPPDLIIIDECHHATAEIWKKTIEHFPNALRIGFTATPERLSGEGLIEIFDCLVLGPSISWLVKNGYLSYPRMFRGQNVIPKKMKITKGDYDQKEQEKYWKKSVVVGNVIENYREKLNGLPAVCFCVSLDHCEFMVNKFKAAGFRSAMVSGNMGRTERDNAVDGLRTGEVQILCSCDVISEGFDVPVIAGAILLRRTKSLTIYLQQVGRALRIYPGKKYSVILDHAGCSYEHGHVLDDRQWSLLAKRRIQRGKDIKMPESSVCPKCSGIWRGRPHICPDCGYNLKVDYDRSQGRKPPEEIEGILREIIPDETVDISALVKQTMTIQAMDPRDRHRAMMSNLYKYGDSDRTRGLAKAVGYNDNWTETVWRRIRNR